MYCLIVLLEVLYQLLAFLLGAVRKRSIQTSLLALKVGHLHSLMILLSIYMPCPNYPLYKDIDYIILEATLLQCDTHLKYLHFQRPYFQIRSHSEVLRVKISTYKLRRRDIIQQIVYIKLQHANMEYIQFQCQTKIDRHKIR
jgi:hypothetical protein